MNFGKHGRTVLMSALLAASSSVVFGGLMPGVASAAPGTIKVGGYPADNTGNGNDPHVDTACVGIRGFDIDLSKPVTATFSLQAPTKGNLAPLVVTSIFSSDGVFPVDVTNWLSQAPASAQGYHVKVVVDGKSKTFWVNDLSKGCPQPAPKCPATSPLGASLPQDPEVTAITAGSAVGMALAASYTPATLNAVYTVDGLVAPGPYYTTTKLDGTVAEVWYSLPIDFKAGDHTITLHVGDLSNTCAQKTWTFTSVNWDGSTT